MTLIPLSAAKADEIIVTGAALPPPPGSAAYGTIKLDRDRLLSTGSGRIEEALADVAGLQQFRRSDSRAANPSAQGLTMRALGGNASSRALLLLDGVPQMDPFFGSVAFSLLAPERLQSVRVTRGGGAGAFGAGALAGSIEMESSGREAVGTAMASAMFGSRDAQDYAASVTPAMGRGFASLSVRRERGDGYVTTPEEARGTADVPARYASWSAALRLVAPLSETSEVQLRSHLYRDARTLRFAGADNSSRGEDVSLRFIHRGDWQVEALGYLQKRNFTNVVISATTFRKTLDQRDTPSTGFGGKVELRPPLGDAHLLRIGVDLRGNSGRLAEDAYSGVTGLLTTRRAAGGRTLSIGAYAEDDIKLGDLLFTGGARLDHWRISDGFFDERSAAGAVTGNRNFADRQGWAFTARAGALYRVNNQLSLRAAGYAGFRLPTLNELYRPFTLFPVTTRANELLTPERLIGGEAGIEWRPGPGMSLSLTGFHNRLSDAIANVTIGTNLRQRRNVDAIEVTGLEAASDIRQGDMRLRASYAFADARMRGTGAAARLDGQRPAQSPAHHASVTLGWERPRGPALSMTLRYTSSQFEDDLGVDRLPPALSLNIFASLPLGKSFALVARGENITDRRNITRNAGGSRDLGQPRTLWLGLRYGV